MENIEIDYTPNERKRAQLIAAGLVSTAVSLVVSFLLARASDHITFPGWFGSIANNGEVPARFSGPWWFGLSWHVVSGIAIYPFIMDYLSTRALLTNTRWLKGLVFGFGVWFVNEALLKPAAGFGFFSQNLPDPELQSMSSLVIWLIFALTLEAMTRVRIVREFRMRQDRAA